MNVQKEILIHSSEFPPGPGGIGNHAYNLAKNLTKLNYKVTVFAPKREEFLLNNNKSKNYNYFKFVEIYKGKYKFFIYLAFFLIY